MLFFKKKANYKATVYIDGMSCGHCAARVETAFAAIPGCTAKVDLANKCANVKSEAPLNEKEIFDAISSIGFTPVKMESE